MVTEVGRRKRIKHGAHNESTPKPKVLLKKGDWLDVMDGDGVWNVARVLSVPSPEEVEITYDGWPEEYDEVVYIDSDRVAPYHTFTWAVKCWVKYLNWPLWPSVITIRTPGTPEGIRNLAIENRFYVDFLDNPNFAERDRCWQKKRQVRVFEDNYEKKRTGSTGEHFERALGWVLQSDALPKMPKFHVGTLPAQYKLNPTESVEAVRRRMGDVLWFQSFTQNRMRHQQIHVYDTIGDEEEDDAASDDSLPPTLCERSFNSDENEVESLELNFEEDKGVEEAGVKDSAVADGLIVPESTNDNEDGLRQRFCVMQADKEETQVVDTTGKRLKKTTMISVPRKFDNLPAPRVFDCTNSLLRIPPPSQLRFSTSGFHSGVALTSPSTAVFNSSKGFSMESWFQRKLMADFLNQGSQS